LFGFADLCDRAAFLRGRRLKPTLLKGKSWMTC
jgi:hypothetical protein